MRGVRAKKPNALLNAVGRNNSANRSANMNKSDKPKKKPWKPRSEKTLRFVPLANNSKKPNERLNSAKNRSANN